MEDQPSPAIDLVWGVKEIARVIGRNKRQTYDMCASGHLPARQIGTRWVADRSQLVRFFSEATTGEARAS